MKISVVSINYNNYSGLERTLKSIEKQEYQDMEYIIVDGGSDDGSLELIKKYKNIFNEKKINYTWISEKDKGIYDALNKGIKMSVGDFIIFINSGDCLVKNILKEIDEDLKKNKEYDFIYGNTQLINSNGKILKKEVKAHKLEKIENSITPFCHQSVFINGEYHRKELYDCKYRLVGDYDFFLKSYKNCKKFKYVNRVISQYEYGGVSLKQEEVLIEEYKKAGILNGINPIKLEGIYIFRKIKKIIKRIIKYKKYLDK